MDINLILFFLSLLVLASYVFDLLGKKFKFSGVILLILFGMLLSQLASHYNYVVPLIRTMLPVFGTIGLILIVLEGSLDLNLSADRLPLIKKTLWASLIIVLGTCGLITFALVYFFDKTVQIAFVNSIPLSIISSAIAIPSAQNLPRNIREFVTLESTLTDIIGVLLFNAAIRTDKFTFYSLGNFLSSIVFMTFISIVISLIVVYFIDHIKHHVKFLPIFALLILVYAGAKAMHQSPLILILVFGLMLNNTDLFVKGFFEKYLNNEKLKTDLKGFKQLTSEVVFFVRTFFFIILGFSVNIHEAFTENNLIFALFLINIIIQVRWLGLLAIDKKLVNPILYFTPRGLITVLLFLSIPKEMSIPEFNVGVLMMVLFLSLGFMMWGTRYGGRTTVDG
jgi:Kef-type K+ transport system membrane component KefB